MQIRLNKSRVNLPLKNAVIWSVIDNEGIYYGQASLFNRESIEPIVSNKVI
jgi:hypothetical protein